MRKAALAADIGDTTAHNFNNCLGNILIMLTDNNNLLFIIKACDKSITAFAHNEKGQQCVQHRLNTKERHTSQKQANIEGKASSTNRNRIMLLDYSTNDIRTAARAAHAVHKGGSYAIKHTAGNTG